MILALTIGFDEKFAIRALMRHGATSEDKFVVIVPKYRPDPRAEKAFNAFNDFVTKYLLGAQVDRIEVDVSNFVEAIITLSNLFRSWTIRPIILNLSGGMRALVVEVSIAALISSVDMKIEIESEDGSFLTEFDTSWAKFDDINRVEEEILREVLRTESTIAQLAERIGISRVTIWRRVKRLAQLNLVELSNRATVRGRFIVRLTDKGRTMLNIHSQVEK